MSWAKHVNNIVEFAIIAIVGFGLALYLGQTFLGTLPSGSVANSAVNAILYGFSNGITTVLVPVIAIAFILFLYALVKASGILGGLKGKEKT